MSDINRNKDKELKLELDRDVSVGVGLDPNDSLVDNKATSYISIAYLYQFMKLNYTEDDNPETNDDNKMLKKYRNVLMSKGVSTAVSQKLYVIASRTLKKVFNDDKMAELREFNKAYRKENLDYSREAKVTRQQEIKREIENPSPKNGERKIVYPNPFEVGNPYEIKPPSPYNKKKTK